MLCYLLVDLAELIIVLLELFVFRKVVVLVDFFVLICCVGFVCRGGCAG